MKDTPKPGTHVQWNTRNGPTEGKVEKKLTADTQIKKQKIKASEAEPKVLVKSDKSGSEAAHKPSALHKK